ncbi:MAG: hypothetical protein ACTTJV_10650 [Ottowia sp.]
MLENVFQVLLPGQIQRRLDLIDAQAVEIFQIFLRNGVCFLRRGRAGVSRTGELKGIHDGG